MKTYFEKLNPVFSELKKNTGMFIYDLIYETIIICNFNFFKYLR